MTVYATIDMVKSQLKIDPDDTRRDDEISSALDAAASSVDHFCQRTFATTGSIAEPASRVYDTAGGTLVIDDLQSLSGIEYEVVEDWTAYDQPVVTLPRNAAADSRPITMLRTRSGLPFPSVVRVSGVWGWPTVPAAIVEATVIEAVAILSAKAAPSGDTGGDPLLSMVRPPKDLSPKAKSLAARYQRLAQG